MRVISVNVGLPREIEWRGQIVTTAIIKKPVDGRVAAICLIRYADKESFIGRSTISNIEKTAGLAGDGFV
jgi:MOSC domain-containing protein YiiM